LAVEHVDFSLQGVDSLLVVKPRQAIRFGLGKQLAQLGFIVAHLLFLQLILSD